MYQSATEFLKNLPISRFTADSEKHRIDWINPVCILLLGLLGIFFIHSANPEAGFWKKQAIIFGAGMVIYFITGYINYKFVFEYAHWFYAGSLILLIMLFTTPLGLTRNGSTRWLDLQVFLLQPSEMAKMATLIMAASILERSKIGNFKESMKTLGKIAVTFLLPIWLIFRQPDLGSSLVFPPMAFAILFLSNLSRRFFIAAFAVFAVILAIVLTDAMLYKNMLLREGITAKEARGMYQSVVPIKDYQRDRILGPFYPEVIDPNGKEASWQLTQSRLAVAGGGFAGKGFGNNIQTKAGWLPTGAAHNDFIFSVLAEKSGFVGSILILTLFFILVTNSVRIAGIARDRFGTLLAIGVSIIFMVHIFENIGMTIGLMPITGLPLPFLSYGGSFVLSCCVMLGLVQSVYRFRKDFS